MTSSSPLRFLRIQQRLAAVVIVPILALAMVSEVTAAQLTEAAQPVVIRIDNFTFGPETVIVAPGTEITWINSDDIPHTVVVQSKLFRSKTLDTDDRYSFTFEVPGEYPYFCSLHPHMTGKVVVKATAG